MTIPANLKYTEEHEWVKIEGNQVTIGITDFAQEQLGEIVFVELEPVGETFEKGETVGSLEAVKTVSDIYLPLTGTIIAINETLEDAPELINSSPYEEGWLIKIEIKDDTELDNLLTSEAYIALTE